MKTFVGAVAGAAVTTGFAYAIALQGFGDFALDRRIIFVALFTTFALLLGGVAITYAIEVLGPSPVLTLSDQGMFDRRVSRQPVPWRLIRGVAPIQHGMSLMLALDVTEPQRISPPVNPVWRINRRAARLLGNPELTLRLNGLDIDLFALLRAIEEHQASAFGEE
ncbi:MAG: hypothetical protein V4618_10430 [Pseudomonadota bacterium]